MFGQLHAVYQLSLFEELTKLPKEVDQVTFPVVDSSGMNTSILAPVVNKGSIVGYFGLQNQLENELFLR